MKRSEIIEKIAFILYQDNVPMSKAQVNAEDILSAIEEAGMRPPVYYGPMYGNDCVAIVKWEDTNE